MNKKRVLANIVIVICVLILALIIGQKLYKEVSYKNNTEEVKQELSSELPVCEKDTIETSIVDENLDYGADELMGSIYIPKFDLTIPLYMENENDSSNWVLELGVAMDNAGSYPYGDTSTVVYGHRHYDLQVLKDIEVGDEIIVNMGENIYLYEVTSTEIIGETQVEEVFTNENELILYTCYPFYWGATTNERFVVHATPVDTIEC